MAKKKNKDLHSTTPEPFRPWREPQGPDEDPDKTKKKEKSDPTRYNDPDITSTPREKNKDSGECVPGDEPEADSET